MTDIITFRNSLNVLTCIVSRVHCGGEDLFGVGARRNTRMERYRYLFIARWHLAQPQQLYLLQMYCILDGRAKSVLVIFLLTIMTWRKCYVGWSIRIGQRAYTSNGGRILWSGTSSPRKQSKHVDVEGFAVTCIVCCLLASYLNLFSMQICSQNSGRPVSEVNPWNRERERERVFSFSVV